MERPRDMTRAEFKAALRRRGWRQVLMWVDIGGGTSIGMVMLHKGRRGWTVDRRASLAKAIRESEHIAAKTRTAECCA